MVEGIHRSTRIIVDGAAIRHNISEEISRLDNKSELFAVIKANGYGHGIRAVAKLAKQAGATGFCVALLDEALDLREAGFVEPILVLGITPVEHARLAAEKGISLTVGNLEWLQEAAQNYLEDIQLKIHLGLDTGMGRIGFQTPSELTVADKFVNEHQEQFDFEGVFTHFATADEKDETYFKLQVGRFKEFMNALKKRPKYVHVSNTATSLWHAACNGNMIRFGVGIYGMNPSGREITPPYELQPAMSLVSDLSFVKKITAGRSISYGATYTAKNDEWIGTIPIGYADGYERRLTGFHVLVDGNECEIVGRICMDQMMVRLPKEFPVGTTVVLAGRSGNQIITMTDIADYANTINYEITCGFTERIPREYKNMEVTK
ncbi:alanine racemase [Pediococcus claussenii]|uniref:Alanine racemase n=1 Tax=Pediococcus claussenii (strain ATCC BAA-344 / DSM 14800 / JCM 18046 / KCTC 3811 / LMG 21948 / P06) TaxID=701521 RepID=G8PAB3_PEDCP|nr:alanine racemase [Pediococcus claussenii]AEV94552.1 alanine racemase [Pediococcus claussenii ATCC BAA-344]ANZ69767.1 alanine racemase [Pediococcus claussenii]ANZ71584.1 alanine racemase [Pediococcus claussenii]KRN19742.1 alr protein [Pediococcus claussenii]